MSTNEAAQWTWCRGMRNCMHQMVETVEYIGSISLPRVGLDRVACHMNMQQENLDQSDEWGTDIEALPPSIRAEHALFVNDLAALITVLVPQLERFSERLNLPERQQHRDPRGGAILAAVELAPCRLHSIQLDGREVAHALAG